MPDERPTFRVISSKLTNSHNPELVPLKIHRGKPEIVNRAGGRLQAQIEEALNSLVPKWYNRVKGISILPRWEMASTDNMGEFEPPGFPGMDAPTNWHEKAQGWININADNPCDDPVQTLYHELIHSR